MRKYRVYYESSELYYIDIDAKSKTDAKIKARDTDGGDFSIADFFNESTNRWEFKRVTLA